MNHILARPICLLAVGFGVVTTWANAQTNTTIMTSGDSAVDAVGVKVSDSWTYQRKDLIGGGQIGEYTVRPPPIRSFL